MQKCPHAGTPPIALFIVQECCIVFGVVTDTAFKTTGNSEIADFSAVMTTGKWGKN